MSFILILFLVGVFFGMLAVISNPSPYYAALGLVVVAAMGCGILAIYGGGFLALVLFLIYLGGMLVVFAYSSAFCADPYPDDWTSMAASVGFIIFMFFWVWLLMYYFWCVCPGVRLHWAKEGILVEFISVHLEVEGVGEMYSDWGGGLIGLAVWVLLQTLIVVFDLTRGRGRGPFREF